jgi:DNA mismatch repair protein MSH6
MEEDKQVSESSSGDSVCSEDSEPDNDSALEEFSPNKKTKKNVRETKPKVQVYDNQTMISVGGSSTTLLPSSLTPNAKKLCKSPLEGMEDIEEIDGQKIPQFIRKEFIRDKNLRKPEDPEYDPSTVEIPKQVFEKLTPGMKRYWEIKKDHFDSVILWRKGDWYIVFYYDIQILNQVVDSNPRTFHNEPGFYHNRVDEYIAKLIKAGFKVVRVEQTETHVMMQDRVKNQKVKSKDAIVGREIVGKYTKGTFQKPLPIEDFLSGKQDEDEELDTKFVLLYLYNEEDNVFGITYFDITTLQFYIGQFKDDSMR